MIWLIVGVMAIVTILAIGWSALVAAARSDAWAEALQQAIYGEGEDGNG